VASAASLLGMTPYRGFHIGYPGSGKTGALAALANVGYKLRILDYTGNFQPLVNFLDERVLADPTRVDIITLQDKLKDTDGGIVPSGVPKAFSDGLKYLMEWKYTDDDGNEVNLGRSSEWGRDTIVVLDELTTLSKAAKNRAMVMSNKTPKTMTSAVWGASVADVVNMITVMKSKSHHMIVNAHKQILGAQDMTMQGTKDNEEVAKMVNEEVIAMKEEGLIPTRIFPVGPTKNASQTIHGELPIMLEFEKISKAGKEMRVIKTEGPDYIDVKFPSNKAAKSYPVETGLADIFSVLGYVAPGF